MTLELSAAEREILIQVLERELSEMGPQIRHSQHTDYRDELKQEKRTLQELRDRLAAVSVGA